VTGSACTQLKLITWGTRPRHSAFTYTGRGRQVLRMEDDVIAQAYSGACTIVSVLLTFHTVHPTDRILFCAVSISTCPVIKIVSNDKVTRDDFADEDEGFFAAFKLAAADVEALGCFGRRSNRATDSGGAATVLHRLHRPAAFSRYCISAAGLTFSTS